MAKKRPFGVTLLAILAGIAAVVAIVHTLQFFGILKFNLFGELQFIYQDWLGGILWGVMAAIWIWVARMLWNVNPQGWLFVVALATINIIFNIVAILGQSSWEELALGTIVSVIILIYGLLPGTKAAFGQS